MNSPSSSKPNATTSTFLPLDGSVDPDVARCGGKAAGLIELARASLPVVPGFCITTDVQRAHMEQVAGPLAPVLAQGDGADGAALALLRDAIEAAPLSPAVLAELEERLESLPGDGWAVRSSAAQEDGSRTSFAGLHDSILNVRDLDGCARAVKRCWASLYSDRAHAYRARHGIRHDQSAMAVVVQPLVPATAAGVVFSIDPATRDPAHLVVEAVTGLGEPLVAGRTRPDRFRLRREDGTVLEHEFPERRTELVAHADGGTLERAAAAGPAIDEATARRLGEWVVELVATCGAERDVEWARDEAGEVYFVQSRPITVPAKSSDERREGQVWSNLNSGEVMPDVVTPMSWSLLQAVERMLKEIARIAGIELGDHPLVGRIGGRVYFNLNTVVAAIRKVPFGHRIDLNRSMGGLTTGDRNPLDIPDRYLPDVRTGALSIAKALPRLLVWMVQCRPSLAGKKIEQLAAYRLDPEWQRLDEKSSSELAWRIANSYTELFADPTLLGIPMCGMSFFDALEQLCLRWFPDEPGLFGHLVSGQGGVASAESGLDLLRLARFIDGSTLRDDFLSAAALASLDDRLTPGAERDEWWRRWHEFLEVHGHHTRGEIELANPRWSERPEEVFAMLRGYVRSFDDHDLLGEYEERAWQSERRLDHCLARLSWPKRWILRSLVHNARAGAAARENIKSEVIRHVALARRVLLELGRRAVASNVFDEPEDIFFLDLEELESLESSNRHELRQRIRVRRSEYEWNVSRTPPPVVFGFESDRETPAPSVDGHVLLGLAVSPGSVEGAARVVSHAATEPELFPGEILVAPFTDPGWTPLMIPAAAIVTDMGGLLSHGSIVARELGIPAVANVGRGTTSLRNGDWLEVDGTAGVVRVIHTVREATAEDARGACDAVWRSIREVCTLDHHDDPELYEHWLANKTPENFTAWIEGKNHSFVAKSGDDPVGFGLMTPEGNVQLCYVAPEGIGQGHGHRLLAAMEDRARELGVDALTLDSTTTARSFYESHGFRPDGAPKCARGLACTPMRKRLRV